MKTFFKKIIVAILTWEARLVLARCKPKIIAVGGNVGKTSTKEVIATVVGKQHRVLKSQKSYNSELGVPLTILGLESAWGSITGWLSNILHGFLVVLMPGDYPEWLVLEVGADRPGDIRKLAEWLPVNIAVFTTIPEVPVHIEYFKSKEQLINEKVSLVNALVSGGTVILNTDDVHYEYIKDKVGEIIEGKAAKVLTYGTTAQAAVQASNDHIVYEEKGGQEVPDGVTFKVDYHGISVPVRMKGVFGRHHIYTALAAFAVAAVLEMNLIETAEALATHEVIPGRFKLLEGIKDTLIIDDTYNSSPVALAAALATLKELKTSGRKIAVIGDMLELGEHTIPAHKESGHQAAKACDILVTVGVRAKFIAEGAKEKKMAVKKIIHADSSETAGKILQDIIKAGDLILIKGSQGMRMEKVVEEIMLHPELKHQLLTRQYENWVK